MTILQLKQQSLQVEAILDVLSARNEATAHARVAECLCALMSAGKRSTCSRWSHLLQVYHLCFDINSDLLL
jgi:hypothetical protein